MKKINKYTLSKYNFWFLLLVLMLSQPVIAQTSLPACTASITDTDGDSITDDDGVSGRIDIDKDGDGLIEICDLDGINEIRYQVDGSGYKANENATKITQGCPVWGCIGYELVGSLNFNSATDYRNGSINTDWTVADYASDTDVGWQPLPHFGAVFNGNDHIIRNLQINRVGENNVGLFTVVLQPGRIENIELVYPNVRGRSNVGGLLGNNNGVVINSYVRDYDTDASTQDTTKYIEAISGSVGGLVGRNNGGGANIGHIINSGAVINVQIKENTSTDGIGANAGGLTGFNLNGAEIRNSYARGDVKGPCGVGGLTANNFSTVQSDPEKNSKIINSYAIGNVTTGFGNCNVNGNVRSGGLTAVNSGLIANSYTTSCWESATSGSVNNDQRGGVVQNNGGTINNSYYQTTDCSGLQQTPSGSNKTQAELQTPIYANGIYRTWLPVEWDFGDNSQYPAIRYTEGLDKDNPGCGYLGLPACDALIKNQLPIGRTVTSDVAPIANLTLSRERNNELDIIISIDQHPAAAGSPLTFPLALAMDGFSNQPNLVKIEAQLGSTKQTYNFNFIPVLSIPAAPTPPLQPSAGESITTWTGVHVLINGVSRENKMVPAFSRNTFNYDIYFQSDYADGVDIFTRIGSNLILQPPVFDLVNRLYKLYDLAQSNQVLVLGNNYQVTDCMNSSCVNDGERLSITSLDSKTVTFNIRDTSTAPATSYGPFSMEYIPIESSKHVVVNSEVNGNAATFTADRALHVEVGDKVSVKVADSLVERDDINRPLHYYWHSSSDPTLFSGTRYGTSTSFNINDPVFRDNQSGDAVLTLAMHDKYDMTAAAMTEEIPIRIFGTLSLSSDDGEVVRDQVASTLHYLVLANTQPQAVINAVSPNKSATLTVDDSAPKVTAVNGDGTSTSSMITVQVDEDSETEFTITVTLGNADITHTVRVFRRGVDALQISEIMLSAQTAANADGTINEGSTATLTVNVISSGVIGSGEISSGEYDYEWSQISGRTLELEDPTTAALNLAIAADFVVSPATMTEVTFKVVVDDGLSITSQSKVVTIIKLDNGGPVIRPKISRSRLDIILVEPDPDAGGNFSYQWQKLELGERWINVVAATTATYWLPDDANENIRYRVYIQHTDGQGYMTNYQRVLRVSVDDDGDGLIDIYYLEDIDSIRYQLDGRGYKMSMDAVLNTEGCSTTGCSGYELRRDLDFNADASYISTSNKAIWTTASGWNPIGVFRQPFTSMFEGNGHTISNLQINNEEKSVGLYSVLHANAKIKNVGLLDVDIGSQLMAVGALVGWNLGTIISSYATGMANGDLNVGGLAGFNSGSIINSYAMVSVFGDNNTGGLVGRNSSGSIINSYAIASVSGRNDTGGLVGANGSSSSIINSYATATVQGRESNTGGLVGDNSSGSIMNSYASGMVSGNRNVGGLVGDSISSIINSYALGMVSGDSNVGGLVGSGRGTSVASYWNTSTTNVMTSASGSPKTTVELQSPIAATGIYSDWSNNDWDFGSSNHYPSLRYAQGGNLNACSSDITPSSMLPPCGVLIPNQSGRDRIKGLAGVFFLDGDTLAPVELNPLFSQSIYHYDMTIVAANLDIQLRPYAINDDAKIAVYEGDTNYFSGDRPNGALSDMIKLDDNKTRITIVVTDTISAIPTNTTYTFVIVRLLPIRVNVNRSRLTLIFDAATPDPDGAGDFSYQWQQQVPGIGWIDIAGATTSTYSLPADADGSLRYRLVNIRHIDGGGDITNYPSQGPFRASIDDDGDGLVDIYILEDLDAMRYQLDGRGYRRNQDADLIVIDCPGQVCSGYELRRDLDFNAATSYGSISNKAIWTTELGWDPIGRDDNPFSSLFEGNGFTISGLYIDNEGFPIGLFSVSHTNSEIKNVGLLDIDISGGGRVGSLVGRSDASIINSYATGTVDHSGRDGGGLVGINGGRIISSFANVTVTAAGAVDSAGLVGWNFTRGLIINSYALGKVSGYFNVGGLVALNSGAIINSYATGDVSGMRNVVGGLVGQNDGNITNTYARGAVLGSRLVGGLVGDHNGSVTNSYATGQVHGNENIGGLVSDNDGSITASYWDTSTTKVMISAGGSSKTTVELQSPTATGTTNTDVYYGWSEADWDFGHSNRYPVLNYVSGDVNACNPNIETSSLLPTCGTPLYQQRRGLDRVLLLVDDVDITELLTPSFSPFRFSYAAALATTATAIRVTLQPLASNANATIKITQQGDATTDYFAGKANDTLSDPIISSHSITLAVVVTDILYGDITTDTVYTAAITLPFSVSEFAIDLTTAENSDGSINEGSTAPLRFKVSGGSGVYQYEYKIVDADGEILLSASQPPIELIVPTDLIAAESSRQIVELNILVSDDEGHRFEHSEEITVRKVDNGLAEVDIIRATDRTLTVAIGSDPDGAATDPDYIYQWQTHPSGSNSQWMNIALASATSYTISDDLAVVGNEFRVAVTYTDGQGYRKTLESNAIEYVLLPICTNAIADRDDDGVAGNIDVDKDGDGLIELCDLEGLSEIRYQLDGSGYKANENAPAIMRGCPLVDDKEQCRGYELVRSLDFNEVASYRANTTRSEWTAGSGWLPISANFSAVFEGNDHSISGLYINRTEAASGAEQGLFSTLAVTAQIKNIRLLDVAIQGFAKVAALSGSNLGIISDSSASGAVVANTDVGGLVGVNAGSIVSSFANVAVTANINGGGLVGDNQGSLSNSHADGRVMGGNRLGGLSGFNNGSIISSYATAAVSGSGDHIGGLVGSHTGSIINSYATGDVGGRNDIGGLVGLNNRLGRIANTYAEGTVMGAAQVGGLVGRHHGVMMNSYAAIGIVRGNENNSNIGGLVGMMSSTATIIASYWDSETSEQASSGGGDGRTTAELQAAVAPGTTTTEVYYGWRSGDWDFGNSSHYPALRYASTDDLNNCAMAITTATAALPCTILLPNQRGRNKGLATVFFFADGEQTAMTSVPPFTPLTASYNMTILIPQGSVSQIQLRPYAINNNATIVVTQQGATTDYFTNKPSGALSDTISLAAATTLMLIVNDDISGDAVTTTYTFTITRTRPPLEIAELIIEPSPTIDEGSDMTITYTVSGGSGIYTYAYKIDEQAFTQSSSSFGYSAPVNLVAADADMQTVHITIKVNDQDGDVAVLERKEQITVRKINNGNDFSIRSEVDASQLRILSEGSDPDGDGRFSYQWQQLELDGEWTNIAAATMATYNVPADSNGSIRYQVNVQHTDGQGYDRDYPTQGPFRVGLIDDDRDGLIDLYYLEDLNAIRYQLDGSSYRMSLHATTSTQGCPLARCSGYELRRDLDFTANASYVLSTNQASWTPNMAMQAAATNLGWPPIGSVSNRFSSVFEGNGFTISNLYTKSGNNKGLYSVLHSDGEVKNVGLLDVYVEGSSNVGALVGQNYGKIISSYVMTGAVNATAVASPAGGITGINQTGSQIIYSFANVNVMANDLAGGLVGHNQGVIMNSYATGDVEGMNDIGGLVGVHTFGNLSNTYAHGAVSGRHRVGGLVGRNNSKIANSYAIGAVSSSDSRSDIGGLVGVGSSTATVSASYWDKQTSGQENSGGGLAQTTAELQTPTAPGTTTTEVYYGWNNSDWDFGDSDRYPRLRHASGLPTQSDPKQGLSAVFFYANGVDVTAQLRPTFSPLNANYDGSIVTTDTNVRLTLRPYAFNDNAMITVTDQDNNDYFSGKSQRELSEPIRLLDVLTLTVVVTDTLDEGRVNTTYTFVLSKVIAFAISEVTISSHTLTEGDMTGITYQLSGGTGAYQYAYQLITGGDEVLLSQSAPPVELTIPADTVSAASTRQTIELNIRVSDGGGQTVEHIEELTIQKVNNGAAEIAISRTTSSTLIVMIGSDPDGDAADSGYIYQWHMRTSEPSSQWTEIDSANAAAYTISNDLAVMGNQFRVEVTYTDGQGYQEMLTSNEIRYTPPGSGLRIRTKVFLEGPLR